MALKTGIEMQQHNNVHLCKADLLIKKYTIRIAVVSKASEMRYTTAIPHFDNPFTCTELVSSKNTIKNQA